MVNYQLTPGADDDLLDIARYTIRTWGEEQANRYEAKLLAAFESIGQGSASKKAVLKEERLDLQVTRCEHHYIFWSLRKNRPPLILAVLHENMKLMARLRERLGS